MTRRTAKVLVLGLGNELLSDDGVGVHAARRLAEDPPPGALVVDIGCAVLDACELLEEAEVVLALDAVDGGGPPGTIYSFDADGARARPGTPSPHERALAGALRLIPPQTRPRAVFLGMQPMTLAPGPSLSAPVQRAVPVLLRLVRRKLAAGLRERVLGGG